MNITLLGNGFDLFYKLPTKYINFLNTIQYLSTTSLFEDQTLGKIFGAEKLQGADSWIAESYEKYKDCYDAVSISYEEIGALIKVKENLWYKYLWKSLNKDTGWIDFEKEIALVIRCFQERFDMETTSRVLHRDALSNEAEYIIKEFDFFIDNTSRGSSQIEYTKKEYQMEYPCGSGNMVLDKEKIAATLLDALKEFTAALNSYLYFFVERLLLRLVKEKKLAVCDAIQHSDYIVTFNYTSTYEKLKLSDQVFHVHGSIGKEIVLGINPDSEDTVGNVNTTFIQFKKYYQRTMLESDKPYIRWISDNRDNRSGIEDNHLLVFGHSLDISDKDIISELFNIANEIVILYHDPKVKSDYISNLVRIFGSDGFSSLRYNKNLKFLDLNSDLSKLVEKRRENKPYWAFMQEYTNGEEIVPI